jgi:hypothetical protein
MAADSRSMPRRLKRSVNTDWYTWDASTLQRLSNRSLTSPVLNRKNVITDDDDDSDEAADILPPPPSPWLKPRHNVSTPELHRAVHTPRRLQRSRSPATPTPFRFADTSFDDDDPRDAEVGVATTGCMTAVYMINAWPSLFVCCFE